MLAQLFNMSTAVCRTPIRNASILLFLSRAEGDRGITLVLKNYTHGPLERV